MQKAVVPLMLAALLAGGALCVLAPAPVLASVAAVEPAADPCDALSGPSASAGPDAAVALAPARPLAWAGTVTRPARTATRWQSVLPPGPGLPLRL